MNAVRVIDSHTEGEPTRVVIDGGPDLGGGSLVERREIFARHHDAFRAAVVNEPRGSDVLVGALLVPPADARAVAGVIFFNNVGPLWGCGHGTIGVARTLVRMGRIKAGEHLVETPSGLVTIRLGDADPAGGDVEIDNVPSFRHRKDVVVNVHGMGSVMGDVAWGGNWFFLVDGHGLRLDLSNVDALTDRAWKIRRALARDGITGADGAEIDHVEFFGTPSRSDCHSRNFVLCPGRAYDRSPCGTGTSAKLACLVADGKLAPGVWWGQESIVGSAFRARARRDGERIVPTIAGAAWITAEATLLRDDRDPFRDGIRG